MTKDTSDARVTTVTACAACVVHYCDWASQPDIHRACGTWTRPAWGQCSTVQPWLDDDGELYSFDLDDVTCPACLAANKEASGG